LHGDICGDKHGNSDLINSAKTKGQILPVFISRAAKQTPILTKVGASFCLFWQTELL
jgi:hypothetical protein